MGLFFMILSIPLIKEKVKMNHWYGIRLPATMKSKEIWYAVNKQGGKYLLYLGIVISLSSLIFYFLKIFTPSSSFLAMTIIILAGTVIFVVKSIMLAEKMAKENK